MAVGCSRVVLHYHYPSDVLGGWLVAAGWGFAVVATLRYPAAAPTSASDDRSRGAAPRWPTFRRQSRWQSLARESNCEARLTAVGASDRDRAALRPRSGGPEGDRVEAELTGPETEMDALWSCAQQREWST